MTIKAHFDGKVIVPDEPVDLKAGEQIEIEVRRPEARRYMTAGELLRSPLVGIWADRQDITDSAAYARQLREAAQNRNR